MEKSATAATTAAGAGAFAFDADTFGVNTR